MRISSYTAAALFFAVGTDARKKLIKENGKQVRQPRVAECDPICIFQNDTNSWCIETTSPHLKVGWDYDQTFDETDAETPMKYWQFQLQPYADTYIYIQSIFNIERLYHNTFTIDLEQFKLNAFFSLIVNGEKQYCPGWGWDREAVDFSILMTHSSMDCYKTIINDICGFQGVWWGEDAKWFESCEKSDTTDVEDMKFTTWNLFPALSDQIEGGTVNPDGAINRACHPLPLLGSTTENPTAQNKFADMAYDRIGSYISTTYMDETGQLDFTPSFAKPLLSAAKNFL